MALIFLNGTTSSGKTSLARELQAKLKLPHLYTGIDVAFDMLPNRFHNHPDGFFFDRDERGLVRLNFGAVGMTTLKAHHRAVAAIAGSGIDCICDEVVLTPELRHDWMTALENVEVTFVGVHCSQQELERRERTRGDRRIGQALGQLDVVHQDMPYTIEIDTTQISPEASAEHVICGLSRSL